MLKAIIAAIFAACSANALGAAGQDALPEIGGQMDLVCHTAQATRSKAKNMRKCHAFLCTPQTHHGKVVDGLCGVVGFCVCFCAAWFGSACLLVGVCVCVCLWWLCCTVVWCGVVWLGTERAVLGRRRCAARTYVGHRTQDDLIFACTSPPSTSTEICLQTPTLVICSTASNAFTMVRGGDKDFYFACMSVCRFDVLLSGGAVGQEMVFEEWKEQV